LEAIRNRLICSVHIILLLVEFSQEAAKRYRTQSRNANHPQEVGAFHATISFFREIYIKENGSHFSCKPFHS
jgi:hypothetical protein